MRLIHHGKSCLLAEHQLQGLALLRHPLQIQVRIGGTQIVGNGAGHAHGDPIGTGQFLQIHRHCAGTRPDDQLRYPHVRVAEQPQTQAGRCLGQTRGKIDFTGQQRMLQCRLVRKVAPGEVQPQRAAEPVHQLDVDPVELLQTPIELGKGCLQHQPDPQAAMLLKPLLLGRLQHNLRRRGSRSCPRDQGQAKTADKQQAAQKFHLHSHQG
ncbi:hypothetical protein D3C79_737120 [compost metagenome]